MASGKVREVMRILGVIMALLIMALAGLLIHVWTHSDDGKVSEPSPMPISTADTTPAITNREDLLTNYSSFYRSWDLQLQDAQGQPFSLSQLYGTPFALTYFASYCADCQREIGNASSYAAMAASEGGAYYLVARADNERETAQSALSFVEENAADVPMLVDEGAEAYEALGVHWIPTTLFFNARGVLMNAASMERLSADGFASRLAYAKDGGAQQTERFVRAYLLDDTGRTAAHCFIGEDQSITASEDVLSETLGMMMEYALMRGDRALFDLCFDYVDREMTVNGLSAWRIQNGRRADTNATLDDLRILDALWQAGERWGETYTLQFETRAGALYQYAVSDDGLVDYSTLKGTRQAETLALCYVDVSALTKLSQYSENWAAVYDRALAILEGGRISDAFPLYYPRYDYTLGTYTGTSLQMNEAALTLLQLAKAGRLPERTVEFLVETLQNGPVYARYDCQGGVLQGYDYDSAATYALLARVGLEIGSEELTRLALWRMENKRNYQQGSAFDGAYGAEPGVQLYAFDLLCAMQTWALFEAEL